MHDQLLPFTLICDAPYRSHTNSGSRAENFIGMDQFVNRNNTFLNLTQIKDLVKM